MQFFLDATFQNNLFGLYSHGFTSPNKKANFKELEFALITRE